MTGGKEDAAISIKDEIKEGAGFAKEELNEHGKSPKSKDKAWEGRELRNRGVSKMARLRKRACPARIIRSGGVAPFCTILPA